MAMANIKDLVVGGRIIKPGSSENFATGDWRATSRSSTRTSA